MKIFIPILLMMLTAACSTVDSRIQKNADKFSSYPPEIQAQIRAKQVAVGFTEDMVFMALGEPDRRYDRLEEGKEPMTVWAYFDQGPHFSFGVGLGAMNGSTAVGGGVSTSTGDNYGDFEKLRVIFRGGKVTQVETLRK